MAIYWVRARFQPPLDFFEWLLLKPAPPWHQLRRTRPIRALLAPQCARFFHIDYPREFQVEASAKLAAQKAILVVLKTGDGKSLIPLTGLLLLPSAVFTV